MINHSLWRDQQLGGFRGVRSDAILTQEKVMLNFLEQVGNIQWNWRANCTKFYSICSKHISITEQPAPGVIVFGTILNQLTSQQLVDKLRKIIQNYNYAYVAVNRYEILSHNFDLELPDSIEQSVDKIMHFCDERFQRLHSFAEVDGRHMVAAHPMDCYGLCKR